MEAEKRIETYVNNYQRFKECWNHEDGCVLLGAAQLYEATEDKRYIDFIRQYLDYFIDGDGSLEHYSLSGFNIENINSGKVLFFMYEKTGEEKYRKAIEAVMNQLREQPRCRSGNFLNKESEPAQIWLDGVYMAQPFYMEYETKYNKKENYNDIIRQFETIQTFMYDKERGLCCRAYDEDRVQPWADKETGCSEDFSLSGMGWYLMALVDVMDKMSIEIYEHYRKLQDIYQLLLKGILRNGMLEQKNSECSTQELSGSLMAAYSILKACRMGILLKEKYMPAGVEMLEYLMAEHIEKMMGEPKDAGVFMMAYAQYLQLKKEMQVSQGK